MAVPVARALDPRERFVGMHRLDEEGVGLEGELRAVGGAGKKHDRATGVRFAGGAGDINAGAIGKMKIKDQAMRPVFKLRQTIAHARGGADVAAELPHQASETLTINPIVLDDQHGLRRHD